MHVLGIKNRCFKDICSIKTSTNAYSPIESNLYVYVILEFGVSGSYKTFRSNLKSCRFTNSLGIVKNKLVIYEFLSQSKQECSEFWSPKQ